VKPSCKGFILAAGLGTRMQPLTHLRAKPAIPFLNRPFVLHALDLLSTAGIREIAVNLHHLPDTVREALGDRARGIRFSQEAEILGTAGGLGALRDFFRGSTTVIINAKIYFEQDLRPVLEFHQSRKALATMVVVPRSGNEDFKPVFVDERARITGFARGFSLPDTESSPRTLYVFTGIQVMEPEVIEQIPEGFSDSVADVYPQLLRGGRVMAYISRRYWCECSTPERYLSKSMELLHRRKIRNLSESKISDGCLGAVIGSEVAIPTGAQIRNSIIWDRVRIGSNCRILNSIIVGEGIRLPDGSRIDDSIVTPTIENVQRVEQIHNLEEHGLMIWPLK